MAVCSVKCTILVLTSILCYVLVLLPMVFAMASNWQPRRQGFFCGDKNISLPFAEDTISIEVLVGMSSVAAVIIAVAEAVFAKKRGLKLSAIFINVFSFGMSQFTYGSAMSAVFVIKMSMGNLRPHFLDVCKANVTCTPGTYVTDDVCTGDDDVMKHARTSFPSGHAAIAGYLASFLALYLQDRVRNKSWVAPRMVIQVGLVMGGLYIMGSRVADHQHHLADVIGGAVLGVAFGIGGLCALKELTKPSGKKGVLRDTDVGMAELNGTFSTTDHQ